MYGRPNAWARMQQHCIAMNGSFFNTDRMLGQYFANAYFPQAPRPPDETPEMEKHRRENRCPRLAHRLRTAAALALAATNPRYPHKTAAATTLRRLRF